MRRETLNGALARRIGLKRALYVEVFVMLWAMYEAANGEEPATIEALAGEIGKSPATVYRWQADYREAFPQWSTPRDLLDFAGVEHGQVMTLGRVRGLVVV